MILLKRLQNLPYADPPRVKRQILYALESRDPSYAPGKYCAQREFRSITKAIDAFRRASSQLNKAGDTIEIHLIARHQNPRLPF